uniref:Uncharacterized protein n=1 Tax=Anguilla anguilla TaxID=7936 RepID=A0A0E9RLC9_ANGAN
MSEQVHVSDPTRDFKSA